MWLEERPILYYVSTQCRYMSWVAKVSTTAVQAAALYIVSFIATIAVECLHTPIRLPCKAVAADVTWTLIITSLIGRVREIRHNKLRDRECAVKPRISNSPPTMITPLKEKWILLVKNLTGHPSRVPRYCEQLWTRHERPHAKANDPAVPRGGRVLYG